MSGGAGRDRRRWRKSAIHTIIFQENINSVEEMVQDAFGEGTRLERTDRVYGGDINDAYRVNPF